MARVFFTADTHFGHAGIIGLCKRPFSSVQEMDEALVTQWNAVVTKTDTVWHLGDFAHRAAPDRAQAIFRRLNGTKHLVIGNHDTPFVRTLDWASTPCQIAEISAGGQRVVMCHYAMRTWPGQHRGAIHLFGHSHGRLPASPASCDMGVDCWSFYPASLDQISMRLQEQAELGCAPDPTLPET